MSPKALADPPPRPDPNHNPRLEGSLFAHDQRVSYVYETEKYVYTDKTDGVKYEYDEAQKAWFPMFDESLLAAQQSVYSVVGVNEEESQAPPQRKEKRKAVFTGVTSEDQAAVKKPKPAKAPPPNTSIYVTNLPQDTDEEEMKGFFSKCGLIMSDVATGKPRIKLYRNASTNQLKGDALITFFKEESVALAIQLLDESEYRIGKGPIIRVSKAQFTPKEPKQAASNAASNKNGEATHADVSGGQKAKPEKRKIRRTLNHLNKQLGWFEEDTEGKKAEKSARVVILKGMFTPMEIESDPTLLLDLKEDVRGECEKCGEVTNVVLYDKSDEGVMSVKFKEQSGADSCIQLMNGRYFAGRRISAEMYDGKTKYDKLKSGKEETEEEEKARLERYAKWLEGKEGGEAPDGSVSAMAQDARRTAVTPPPEGSKAMEEDENTSIPEGAILLPGGGWAVPPKLREETMGNTPEHLVNQAWGKEADEDRLLEAADEDEDE
ncbi:hypothetical protein M427DRAFT_51042 [Gonapodya prolifera JEL478]|uniref:RRM domain-containing protein n=1 Tax=Gonapodya prolifera (strain JEL478) TaxID=1344416 RepID=A0A139AYH8_GONPJ|nr:hypothetical protein M427DRAFT_51042 [Gonapodya prolifera JEL478]|eukprot:KXS21623.1 hypothetical protein M427DRAFT_51042 [Gonapodya prolifera JEL478]